MPPREGLEVGRMPFLRLGEANHPVDLVWGLPACQMTGMFVKVARDG